MKWYLDLMLGLDEEGWEVYGDPHRWFIHCNWKIPAENFAGDDYHTVYLHKSMYDVGVIPVSPDANMFGKHIHAEPGHTISFSIAPDTEDPGPKFWGLPADIVDRLRPTKITKEQFEIARRARISVGTIFPNLSFLLIPLTGDPKNRPPATYLTVRQWQPSGPDRIEVWSWILVPKIASQEFKQQAYMEGAATFSTSGLFEQDDAVPWPAISRTARAAFARKSQMKLNYQMGLEGISVAELDKDFPGPGVVYNSRYEEGVQRSFLKRWATEIAR